MATASSAGPLVAAAETQTLPFVHQAAVFSDDPRSPHDPRHLQPQTGADKMFAPIGLIETNHREPDQGPTQRADFHMGTAFLVSPCYVLTNYHVVFGYRKTRPVAGQDYSATFRLGNKAMLAVPAKFGQFNMFRGRDWVLLLLQPTAVQRCLGEEPTIGWLGLSPLSPADAMGKPLSVAGYPSDKSITSLWRQDTCHLFEKSRDIENDGMWTTDCATRPRASGSPIFFVGNGALHVVALMTGHAGDAPEGEILPSWDPKRANFALDIGKIISSDPEFLKLIKTDIERFHEPNPAQVQERARPAPPARTKQRPRISSP